MPEERLYLDGEADIFYNSFENEYYLNHEGRIHIVQFDNIVKKNYICIEIGDGVIKP